MRKGRRHLDHALPGILEDAETKLSGALRFLLAQLKLELDQLAERMDHVDQSGRLPNLLLCGANQSCLAIRAAGLRWG